MESDLVAAIVGGIVSGAVSGALTSQWYIRRVHLSSATQHGQLATGHRNQMVTAASGSQAAATKRGSVTQSVTNLNTRRGPEIAAEVVRHSGPGMPSQMLVLQNLGDAPAESLTVRPTDDGGGFLTAPDFRSLPQRLPSGKSVEVPCVTSGAGYVRMVVQFNDEGRTIGPYTLPAPHK